MKKTLIALFLVSCSLVSVVNALRCGLSISIKAPDKEICKVIYGRITHTRGNQEINKKEFIIKSHLDFYDVEFTGYKKGDEIIISFGITELQDKLSIMPDLQKNKIISNWTRKLKTYRWIEDMNPIINKYIAVFWQEFKLPEMSVQDIFKGNNRLLHRNIRFSINKEQTNIWIDTKDISYFFRDYSDEQCGAGEN